MTNRFANLVGSKHISDDFNNINIGFDRVQAEVDAGDAVAANHIANADIHVTKAKKTEWDNKAPGSTATELINHIADQVAHLTQTEHTKLTGIESGAEKNQNAFAKVNGMEADNTTDEFTIVGDVGIKVTQNPNDKTVHLTVTGDSAPGDHAATHLTGGSDPIPVATDTTSGLMSPEDKQAIEDNADAIRTVTAQLVDTVNALPSISSFPSHKKYRAWQGVTTDGTYIYVVTDRDENFTLKNIISVYDMKGHFVSEKLDAYTATDPQDKFMSFGDCTIIDSKLYVTAYNINDGGNPRISRIIEYSLPNIELIKETDIGSNAAECIVKKDGAYWVCYFDDAIIRKFDLDCKLLQTYPVNPIGPDGGYESLLWIDDELYCNMHGPNTYGKTPTGKLDRYTFDGSTFTFVESIVPPTYGTTQGLAHYNSYFYWADRVANEIVITNSVKVNKIKPFIKKINTTDIIKLELLNGWVSYDDAGGRPLRAFKDQMGIVHLEGMIKGGVIGSVTSVLPVGYLPQFPKNFAVDSAGAFGRVAIQSSGHIVPQVGSSTYVCFDGITFLADPTL
ncbi:hypothetical protein RE628_20450 [Paenibacillus sp. D2_2]|uniref:hypothetical protein n=1 Tax=Paenibacillus sp. D2_2 TaxID=3073092 RepID=UPI002815F4AA|nr:hypothetical protein [Paenibacillus sp. D2_2]WMT39742.1 hypothetical protein RE628_20450 [Paenibacillus sp. D2_2]